LGDWQIDSRDDCRNLWVANFPVTTNARPSKRIVMSPDPRELTGTATRSFATMSMGVAAQWPFDGVKPKLTTRWASTSSQLCDLESALTHTP
jgi:hypothetical protein